MKASALFYLKLTTIVASAHCLLNGRAIRKQYCDERITIARSQTLPKRRERSAAPAQKKVRHLGTTRKNQRLRRSMGTQPTRGRRCPTWQRQLQRGSAR